VHTTILGKDTLATKIVQHGESYAVNARVLAVLASSNIQIAGIPIKDAIRVAQQ